MIEGAIPMVQYFAGPISGQRPIVTDQTGC